MARTLTPRWRQRGAVLLLVLAGSGAALALEPPAARIDAIVETLHGTTVADPYRWIENLAAAETREWLRAQDAYARDQLDAIPGRAPLRDRMRALNAGDERVKDLQWAGERLFYLKRAAGDELYRLCMRDGPAGTERVLVDPARLGSAAAAATIDYFRASPNGQRVAYGISLDGSEDATLHVIDVTTQRAVGAPIPRARSAAPAWRFDSSILFFTQQREPAPGAAPPDLLRGSRAFQRTYGAGGSTLDAPLLGAGLSPATTLAPDDTPSIETSPVSPFVVGVIQHGVQRDLSLYVARLTELRGADTPWRKLAGPERGIVGFDLRGEWIYVVTHEGAPRFRVLRWSLNAPGPLVPSAAAVVVPESERVVRGIAVAKEALYVQQVDAGHARLVRLPFNPNPRKPPPARSRRGARVPAAPPPVSGDIPLPIPGALDELVTDPLAGGALLRLESWTQAPGYFSLDARTGALAQTLLLPPARADFRDVAVTRARVRSHDGVEVPVSIVHRAGVARDGSARVLLDVYGAYGIGAEPRFMPSLLAWLERGGVFVVAHVRGGGELGHDWHVAGMKSSKANSWRDAVAVGDWLVQERWTVPARLAVTGNSAGAIAAGRAMIERPALFAAFASLVGFHDTLRSETGTAGPANVAEFGSVAEPDGFRDLLAMSTYANLRDGVAYPAALFTAGIHDPRVDAWDPAKTAARLQAINAGPGGSGRPVLLRVDFAGGHDGATASARADTATDVLAFLLWQTGASDFRLP